MTDFEFLGSPPSPRVEWMGRVTWMQPDARSAWVQGWLTLPSGVAIPWIAGADTVSRSRRLFAPQVRVVVAGHELGGPTYLTGIRAATDGEWQAALDHLAAIPAA